jgi:hypothetical protein
VDAKKIRCDDKDWLQLAGSCEHGKESTGSIKAGEYLDHLGDYQLVKDSLPCSCLHR